MTLTGSTPAGQAVAAAGGRAPQEDRARAGRQRPLRRARGRRPGAGRRDLRGLAPHQQRPELHRGQAVHRGGAGAGALRGAVRREDEGAEGGRPAGRGDRRSGPLARHDLRDDAPRARSREASRAGRACSSGGAGPDGPGAFYPADRPHRRGQGHAGLRRGAVRARGGRDRRRAGRGRRRCASPTTAPSASAPRSSPGTRARGERLAARGDRGRVAAS